MTKVDFYYKTFFMDISSYLDAHSISFNLFKKMQRNFKIDKLIDEVKHLLNQEELKLQAAINFVETSQYPVISNFDVRRVIQSFSALFNMFAKVSKMCINTYVFFQKETNKLTVRIEDPFLVLNDLDMTHM